jgi:hypothetical protein
MLTKTGIAVATMLVVSVSSHAMAQGDAPNVYAPPAASQEGAVGEPLLTEVAWRTSPRSTHSRFRQSRNAGLQTGESTPLSSPQAPESGYDPHWPADNYQYWRQACCM